MSRRTPVIRLVFLASLLTTTRAFADDAERNYVRGVELMQEGKLEEAEAKLREAVRLRPNHGPAHLSLGNVLRKLNHCDQAVPEYEAAAKLVPKDAFVRGNLGVCLAKLNRRDEAIKAFEEAIAMAPEEVPWRLSVISLYRQANDWARALPHADKAVKLEPKNTEALRTQANVLRHLKMLDKAAQSIAQAIALAPNDANLRMDLAVVLHAQSKRVDAIAAYKEAVRLDGSSPTRGSRSARCTSSRARPPKRSTRSTRTSTRCRTRSTRWCKGRANRSAAWAARRTELRTRVGVACGACGVDDLVAMRDVREAPRVRRTVGRRGVVPRVVPRRDGAAVARAHRQVLVVVAR
jgi:tetratricopeptide (TPR) repeat protein